MNRRTKRALLPAAATALVAAMLPWGPTDAAIPVSTAAEDPPFAGYSAFAKSTPVHLEIYEPTIPIPVSPQVEVSFGYSNIEADSASTRGRASTLWPGDAVGEGFKTIIEGVGLPGSLAEDGYPNQVNASQPSGENFEKSEDVPGSSQRAKATPGTTFAEITFSSDAQAQEREDEEGGAGGDSPLPELPLPGIGIGGLSAPVAAEEEEPPNAGVPPELAAVFDFGAYTAVSKTTNTPNLAFSTSRASISDVTLLGGVITLDGVRVKGTTKSDGSKGTATGVVDYGRLTVAGQKFRMGPDGFELVGQQVPIPGLPDDAATALKRLGVTVRVPEPNFETPDDSATAAVEGIVFDIDTAVLRQTLPNLPLNDLVVDLVPDETGQLKSALQAAVNLASRFVITVGSVDTTVDTAQPIDLPPLDDPEAPEEPEEETEEEPAAGGGGATGGGAVSSGGAGDLGGTSDAGAAPDASAGALSEDLIETTAGLPELFSIPGVLLYGGLLLGAVLGNYLRRLGILALGGGAACSHGLASGLPDLRKA